MNNRSLNGDIDNCVCFLLGAGAEISYGFPSGNEFIRDILIFKETNDIHKFFNSELRRLGKFRNDSLLDSRATSVLYQTIKENLDFWEKWFPNHEDRQTVKRYLSYKKDDSDFSEDDKEKIRKAFQKLFMTQICERITKPEEGESGGDILKYVNFYSFIDSKLNCLRLPSIYPNECKRVIRFFYGAHHSLAQHLHENSAPFSYQIKPGESVRDRRQRFAAFLNKAKPEKDDGGGDSYYDVIRSNFDVNEVCVVTSNYTKIAENKIGIAPERIAYIHGRLDLFEDLITKEVNEIERFEENQEVFPFLFVPSGVKPIVHPWQINELNKACRFITESKLLVVLGLRLLGADEHVRTIIRERLNKGKRVLNLIYASKEEVFSEEQARIKEVFTDCDSSLIVFCRIEGAKDLEKLLNSRWFEQMAYC